MMPQRAWYVTIAPSTPFGPVGEDVVVVGQPIHNAPRFIVFHVIGQHTHLRGAVAPMLRIIHRIEGHNCTPEHWTGGSILISQPPTARGFVVLFSVGDGRKLTPTIRRLPFRSTILSTGGKIPPLKVHDLLRTKRDHLY